MNKIRQIIMLHIEGIPATKIAKITHTARSEIRRHIIQFTALNVTAEALSELTDEAFNKLFRTKVPIPANLPVRMQEVHQFFLHAEKQLKHKYVAVPEMWKQYIKLYPKGYTESTFNTYYLIWKKHSRPALHVEHKVGDKMFVDYAGTKLKVLIDAHSGKIMPTEVFVAILGASQLTYVQAVESQKADDFILCCENALHYFTGAPSAIVTDNLKSAVIKSSKYEPTLNEQFEAFADHYGMAVIPARAYKPTDKALVEGAVKLTYNRIYPHLKGKSFISLDTLNETIKKHLEGHNTAPFKGRPYSRRSQFEEIEKAALQPLPTLRFELRRQYFATVMKNGHVSLAEDKHYYSTPHYYIGKKVKLIYSKSNVEIYYKNELIATHPRVNIPYRYTTSFDHLVAQHRFVNDRSPEYFLKQARSIHSDVADYLEQVMMRKAHPEQAYKACQGILSFANKASPERLIKACQRAHQVGWYNFKIIESILQRGLDKLATEEELEMPAHENIRGGDYYK